MNPNLTANPTAFAPPSTIVGQTNAQINAGQPALNQVSAQSPNFNPSLQAPPNATMPDKSPMARFSQGLAGPQPQQQPTKPPQNPLHARADLIVKALTNHLAALDKMLGGGVA